MTCGVFVSDDNAQWQWELCSRWLRPTAWIKSSTAFNSHQHNVYMAADSAFHTFCCHLFLFIFGGPRRVVAMIIKKINFCDIYSLAKVLLERRSFPPFSSHYLYDYHCLSNSWWLRVTHCLCVCLRAGAPAAFSPGNLSTSSSASSTLGSPDNDEYILSFETIDKMRRVSSYSSLNSLIGMYRFIPKICTLKLLSPLHLMQ